MDIPGLFFFFSILFEKNNNFLSVDLNRGPLVLTATTLPFGLT